MSIKLLFVAAVALTSAAAYAEDVAIPRRATIYSAEGTKIGKIEQIVENGDGKPQAVKVIYRGKFVTIPASTLTSAEKGLMTSLSNDTLKKM